MAVLDGDARYMENFADYITGHYRHRFNLLTFSSSDAFIGHMRSTNAEVDILLVAAEVYGDWATKLDLGIIIMLGGGGGGAGGRGGGGANGGSRAGSRAEKNGAVEGDAGAGMDTDLGMGAGAGMGAGMGVGAVTGTGAGVGVCAYVDRYSGADKLVADILAIYANSDRQSVDAGGARSGRDSKICVVMSAEGGCGRTSVAIALCSHYAKLGLRALYIGLDFLNAESFAFDAEDAEGAAGGADGLRGPFGPRGGGLSDIIYTLKAKPDKLGLKIEALAKPVAGVGFYYFSSPLYPMDIDELQLSDIETLVSRLRGSGVYDRVVFDTVSGLSLRNKLLMEMCDSIFFVARGGAAGEKKLILLKGQIDKSFGAHAGKTYKRCHIVLNRAVQRDGANGLAVMFQAKVTVAPHCDELRDDYSPEALSSMTSGFGAALAEAARRS